MTADITSPKWRGERAAPIDPAVIRFIARETPSYGEPCAGCIFRSQGAKLCFVASNIAVERGQPDCDDIAPSGARHIYVLDESDVRQMDLLGAPHG